MKSKFYQNSLICLSLMLTSGISVHAAAKDVGQCNAKQEFAFNSMGLRQYGFNYDAFLNNVNFLKSIPAEQKPEYEKIGQQAYQTDIVGGTTYAQKESVRRDFANQIYQDCVSPKRS